MTTQPDRVLKVRCVFGDHYDRVYVAETSPLNLPGHTELQDWTPLDPAPSLAVWNHSPDGFAWGYGGSGPAQLALALLLYAGIEPDEATRMHQQFKFDVIAPLPEADCMFEVDVDGWAAQWRLGHYGVSA